MRSHRIVPLAALLAALALGADGPSPQEVETTLARVKDYHGGAGPWAVVGYRMGQRALKETGRSRGDRGIAVVHRCPKEVQYTCMADGLHAATGASVGQMSLTIEEAPADKLRTVVIDRPEARRLTFLVKPVLAASIKDLPLDRLADEGRRVAALPDEALFEVVSERVESP